jgi:hypothetical protein
MKPRLKAGKVSHLPHLDISVHRLSLTSPHGYCFDLASVLSVMGSVSNILPWAQQPASAYSVLPDCRSGLGLVKTVSPTLLNYLPIVYQYRVHTYQSLTYPTPTYSICKN